MRSSRLFSLVIEEITAVTELLHVTDDVLQASDHKLCTILVLLDFPRAFDNINYYVLIAIISYRCDETIIQQQTKSEDYQDGTYSNVAEIKLDFPQGSILGTF